MNSALITRNCIIPVVEVVHIFQYFSFEITILDTSSADIDSLGITGKWTASNIVLPDNIMMQLVVELRSNGSNEAIFMDNIIIRGE